MEPAPDGNLGDLRAGLSPAIPLAKLLLAQFPSWYLKRDLSERSILLSHFADEETVSYSLSTNNFSSAYGSAGSALLL